MGDTGLSRRAFGRVAGAAGLVGLGAALGVGTSAGATGKTFTVTGPLGSSSLSAFDETMKGFMLDRDIPAGQLAVTDQGRLVLARGYSWTDDPTVAVGPTSLFRIASMSKPLTAAAVMTLVQANRLQLFKAVGGMLDPQPPRGQRADPRLNQVTVQRLLQHLGGWPDVGVLDPANNDRVVAPDLGKSLPVSQDDIISWATGRPLDHDPGSGTVLDGSGATVPEPYGWFNLENNEDNGGWLSTAVDMVRFGTLFDRGGPVLSSSSLASVFAVPETGLAADGSYYGLGWWVRPVSGGTGMNTWHTGSLPGTSTILVRTYAGRSWAALFDQRDDPSGLGYGDIDGALWSAAGQVTSWPTTDLFPQYF